MSGRVTSGGRGDEQVGEERSWSQRSLLDAEKRRPKRQM